MKILGQVHTVTHKMHIAPQGFSSAYWTNGSYSICCFGGYWL